MMKSKGRLLIGFVYDDTLDSSAGVAQYIKTLGKWLNNRGHKVSYLAGESKTEQWAGGRVYSLAKNLKVAWGGNRLSIPLMPKSRKIRQIMRLNRFDVLHVQVPYSPLMSQKVINYASPTTAVIGTVHVFTSSTITTIGSKLLKLWYGKSLRRFDKMLSVSSAAQSYAKKAFNQTSEIVPNVVDLSVYRRQTSAKTSEAKKIVFLGRLVERKGCKYLLRAFKQALKELPDARLIIAGDGPQRRELEKKAKKLGISTKVDFLGYVDEDSKIKLLSEADLACFPSLYGESFGIVLIEAMAAGAKVVLGGDNAGYGTVLGGQRELLIDPKNTEAFAKRLVRLLSDEQIRAKIHKWQLSEVEKYNVVAVGPTIERIYYQTIAKRDQSRHN